MDPLITNGIDPELTRVQEKRGYERNPMPRRKPPVVPENPVDEELEQDPDADSAKHTFDDLA
jgi:hypothetical protein